MSSRFRPGAIRIALLAAPLIGVQAAAQPAPRANAATPPALTAQDLESFLDGVVPLALRTNDIAGAVIAVVKDGRVLLARGYGYADLERGRPVDPDGTLFRVASISKLFTATAVMQQVERGQLDLDTDVGRYLDFPLPRKFSDPITLRHLLTHTAGFEEAFKQLPADSGQGVPLREWVSRTTPPQLYRPGTVTAYSNYGSDLAGYIVERVSGTPFAEYVRLHILEPLGMRRSSMEEPLPADLRARLSKEYPTASDPAGEFEVLQGEPSGNLSATATDMARFAIAHLALGRIDGGEGRLLSEESARLMGTTQFRTHPAIPGMGLGFFEEDRHGYRIQGHGGDLARFHSHLSLLMDEGVGFFVSVNSSGRGAAFYSLREAVRDAFLDRYFPRRAPLLPVMANAGEIARRFAGPYTMSRRGESSFARLLGVLVNLDVVADADGSIHVPLVTGADRQPVKWWAVSESLFRNADGSQLIGFVPAGDGLPVRMAFVGGHELHRVGALDSRAMNIPLALAVVTVLLASLLLWPVAAVVRRAYQVRWVDDGVGLRLRAATRLAALAALACLGGFAAFVARAFAGGTALDGRLDPMLAGVRVLGLVGALGTVAALGALVRSVRVGRNSRARAKYLALVLASAAFAWLAIHWKVLAWGFRY